MMRKLLTCVLMGFAVAAVAQNRAPNGLLNRNRLSTLGNRPTLKPQTSAARLANAASRQQAEPPAAEGDSHALNWEGAPSDLILQTYGDTVGKTILKDPACPTATITLKSKTGQKLTEAEYLEAIEIVLEMNGIHLEPYGESFIRALPRKDVRREGIPLIMDVESELKESGRVVSMMIPFKNITTDEAQKVLEGLKSNSGVLLVFERTNSILVTDTEQNINRMLEIVRSVDVATPVNEQVFVRQIKNAASADIKTALEQIVQDSQKEQEKNGKGVNNAATSRQNSQPPRSLLGRRQNNEQPAPVNNASLIMSISDADRGMIRGKVLILSDERSNKLIIITSKSNMDFFDKVIEALDIETTPDTVVKVYRLKYADSEDVSDMINDLIGNSSSGKGSSKNNQNANAKSGASGNMTSGRAQQAKKPANQRTGETKAGELSKDNTTVLSDKRINGLVVMTEKELVPTIEQIIESMDIKLSQVLIETVIIEVQLGNGLNTGIDWVQNGRYYTDNSIDETTGELTPGELKKNELLTGNTGYAQALGGGANGGALAASFLDNGNLTNALGSAFNYVFKSDKLNLSAIISASKNDNRAKYLASPIVMTLDNKEATIDATETRKFFSGYETSSSYSTYMRTPKYDSKDIGIQIKVTPKINPNGTVMLNIEEEYSQVIEGGQSILVGDGGGKESIDTALSRKMSADALVENMQTIILCGLTETSKSDVETGIPILKDIPWVGKWLFGSVKQSESRKELLIFMTPYVLDDAASAQAEAIRRKKALSSSEPWDDHGWSLSELADPVTKKEQMRRLKDEWKKQDDERTAKLAIEQAKVDRAKKLKAMSQEERDLWLEIHKEELKKEEQEELEKKMLDKDSQDALKKLAEEIRAEKLKDAESELKKMEDKTHADNERSKRDQEKAKQEPKIEKPQAEK